MSSIGKTNGDDRREVLERRAALVRARLEQRLDVLDKRRDNLVHRVQSLTKPPVPMLALLAVGVLGTIWIVRRSRSSSRASSETRHLTEPRQRPARMVRAGAPESCGGARRCGVAPRRCLESRALARCRKARATPASSTTPECAALGLISGLERTHSCNGIRSG